MSKKLTAPKYRPVLTATQIQHILALAKTESPSISPASMSLISTLAPFAAKIENAGIAAAYTTNPRVSTTSLEALGATLGAAPVATTLPSSSSSSVAVSTNNQAALLSKEEVWELAYNKRLTNPASCSLQELRDADEYAYLNDLMSEAEIAAFESAN